jgi:hypothetical protein
MTSEKTSILARLTSDILAEKTKVNRTLTPVAGEAKPAVHHTPAPTAPSTPSLPADLPGAFMSAETMTMHAGNLRKYAEDLRRQADDLEKIADGIDVVNGVVGKVEALTKAEQAREDALAQREKERQADEKAKSPDFRTLQKEAQEAVFGSVPEKPAVSPVVEQWTCPEHKVPGVTKTSSKGREFIGCPECGKFQR